MESAQEMLKRKFPNVDSVRRKVTIPYWAAGEITPDEFEHILHGCESLVRFFTGEIPYLGDFLTAVIKNDLHVAFGRADDINTKYMWCYLNFIHNNIPMGLVQEAREKK